MEIAAVNSIRKALIFLAGFMTMRRPSNDSFERRIAQFPEGGKRGWSGDCLVGIRLLLIPEAANGSRECAPDDRLRGYPESIVPHQNG